MAAYEIHQEFRFTVCDEEFSAVRDGEVLLIEETRKNCQEDCHMNGELVLRDGKWKWGDDWSRNQFKRYGNDGVAEAIPAYINANPLPPNGG